MNDEQIRNQINDIIEGELQLGINEFFEEKQRKESNQGMGFVTSEEAKNLKVKVSNTEIDKIIKQYKKLKKKDTGPTPADQLLPKNTVRRTESKLPSKLQKLVHKPKPKSRAAVPEFPKSNIVFCLQ